MIFETVLCYHFVQIKTNFYREETTRPRPKGSKNKVRIPKGGAVDLASMIAEKNAEKDQLNEEIASIQANINDLKAQLKEKRAALKAADKAVAKLEAQKTAAEAKAAQQARQAEIDSALQKLISDGMSVDEILNKLK